MADLEVESSSVSVDEALRWLEREGTEQQIAELDRYGITAPRAFGVRMRDLRKLAKKIGRDHELAEKLWQSGWYEARLLAAFVDDPRQVTVAQMNRWAADFDNWAIVDTLCMHLFDRTAHAWGRIPIWARARPEFKRRAAFALLWSLSVHDKTAGDDDFVRHLATIESGAHDERRYVKKAVNMALRAIGKRNPALNAAAIETARRLSAATDPAPRWVGRHALGELTSAGVRRRLGIGE